MKKLFLIPAFIFFINSISNAQQESQSVTLAGNSFLSPKSMINLSTISQGDFLLSYSGPGKDYDFYNRRSKNQRIIGLSLLGIGLVTGVTGVLLASGEYSKKHGNSNAAGVMFVLSAATGIASIPFMILAHASKHKAKAMIQTQKTGFGVPSNVSRDITGITIAIPLGK